jgi:hypothetical protein
VANEQGLVEEFDMATLETESYVVSYQDDEATKQAVFDRLIAFYKKHESFHGECIMQSDDPQIYAPELVAELADEVFKFDSKLKD